MNFKASSLYLLLKKQTFRFKMSNQAGRIISSGAHNVEMIAPLLRYHPGLQVLYLSYNNLVVSWLAIYPIVVYLMESRPLRILMAVLSHLQLNDWKGIHFNWRVCIFKYYNKKAEYRNFPFNFCGCTKMKYVGVSWSTHKSQCGLKSREGSNFFSG